MKCQSCLESREQSTHWNKKNMLLSQPYVMSLKTAMGFRLQYRLYPATVSLTSSKHHSTLLRCCSSGCLQLFWTLDDLKSIANTKTLPVIRHCQYLDTANNQTLPVIRHCQYSDTASIQTRRLRFFIYFILLSAITFKNTARTCDGSRVISWVNGDGLQMNASICSCRGTLWCWF